MVLIRRIVGKSMQPTLVQGQVVFGLRFLRPKVGDIVIAQPTDRELIKRVTRRSSEGYFLLGDNPDASTDSRHFGWVKPAMIKAVVIRKVHRGQANSSI